MTTTTRNHSTDSVSPAVPQAPGRWLLNRWPTLVAIACAALTFGGNQDDETVQGLAEFIILLQLNYVVAAALQRRRYAWAGLPISIAIAAAAELQNAVPSASLLTALALGALLLGFWRRHLRDSGSFRAQALGMVGFAAVAITAVVVDPGLALYLTAAGWAAHGVWDFVHLWKDSVVARSFAEWCGVIDVLLAAELLLIR